MTATPPVGSSALIYAIDHAARVVRFTYTRQPDFAEWRALMERVLAEITFSPLHVLSDRRALSDAAAPSVIRRMADFVARHRAMFAGSRWAVVVAPAHRAEYGMARMGGPLFERSGVQLRPFVDYDAALRWIVEP